MSKENKSINKLMAHIRQNHGIKIKRSSQKRQLTEIGYYHGYKPYRYVRQSDNTFLFSDFKEVKKLYDADNDLKQVIYPKIMNFETSLKNIVLDTIISNSKYVYIDILYETIFNKRIEINRDLSTENKKIKNLKNNIIQELQVKSNDDLINDLVDETVDKKHKGETLNLEKKFLCSKYSAKKRDDIKKDLIKKRTRILSKKIKSLENKKRETDKSFLQVQSKLSQVIAQNSKRKVVNHYTSKGEGVPIWAIFELLMLNDFATLVGHINESVEKKLMDRLQFTQTNFVCNVEFLQQYIFCLKDLRNAIAHNNVIFDARFRNQSPDKGIVKQIRDFFSYDYETDDLFFYVAVLSFFLIKLLCHSEYITAFIEDIRVVFNQLETELGKTNVDKIASKWSEKLDSIIAKA